MVHGLPGCDLAWTEPYGCSETLTAADEPLEMGPMNSDQDRLEMDRTVTNSSLEEISILV